MHEIEKGSLHTGQDVGGLYVLLGGFELDDHLTGLIIEVLLKLVDSIGKFLDGLGEFGIDWDVRDQRLQSCDFGQDSWILQALECLFEGKVEWPILDEQIEALSLVGSGLLQLLWGCIQFSGELGVANTFGSQFI